VGDQLSEDEQFLALQRLPAQYFVKSMTYGAVDLLKSSLKLDDTAPSSEILIVVGRVPAP
jgi:hypothetical protein